MLPISKRYWCVVSLYDLINRRASVADIFIANDTYYAL